MLTSSKCHLAKFCKVDFRRFILGEKQAFPVGFSYAFPRFLRISKTRLNTSLNSPLKVINVRSVDNNTNLVLFSLSIFLTFFAIAFLERVKPEPYKEESQKPILVILGLSGSLERIAKTIWKAFQYIYTSSLVFYRYHWLKRVKIVPKRCIFDTFSLLDLLVWTRKQFKNSSISSCKFREFHVKFGNDPADTVKVIASGVVKSMEFWNFLVKKQI